jgi:hypothetical protein
MPWGHAVHRFNRYNNNGINVHDLLALEEPEVCHGVMQYTGLTGSTTLRYVQYTHFIGYLKWHSDYTFKPET